MRRPLLLSPPNVFVWFVWPSLPLEMADVNFIFLKRPVVSGMFSYLIANIGFFIPSEIKVSTLGNGST